MYYDAHNHLQDEWLAPHLDRIARAASDLGIAQMVVNGTHPDDWPRVAELAARFPFVRPAYGLHPWDSGRPRPDDWLTQLEARLAADPRASIGEIGIDRWILDSARPDDPRLAGVRRPSLDEQVAAFLPQLALGAKLNRPVTIHCLQAWGALDELLHAHAVPAHGFLLHAYGGPAEMVARFSARGAFFSFNGYFLNPRKTQQQHAFKTVPPDRLLVETDAPAMTPPPIWRTHKLPPSPDGSPVNHPGNLEAAYAALASLRGIPLAELTVQVEKNFTRFFGP